jgi:hypothetical protein
VITLNHRVGGSSPSQPTYRFFTANFLAVFFFGNALYGGFLRVGAFFAAFFFWIDLYLVELLFWLFFLAFELILSNQA